MTRVRGHVRVLPNGASVPVREHVRYVVKKRMIGPNRNGWTYAEGDRIFPVTYSDFSDAQRSADRINAEGRDYAEVFPYFVGGRPRRAPVLALSPETARRGPI